MSRNGTGVKAKFKRQVALKHLQIALGIAEPLKHFRAKNRSLRLDDKNRVFDAALRVAVAAQKPQIEPWRAKHLFRG
jgi:hypothetical protein